MNTNRTRRQFHRSHGFDRQRRRHGFITMELALSLPILGLCLLGLFELSLLFFSRAEVVSASRIGARKASMPGVVAEDVEHEIRKTLEPRLQRSLQVTVELGAHSGDVVMVAVGVPMSAAAPDLLWPAGFSLRGRNLYAETRMIKE